MSTVSVKKLQNGMDRSILNIVNLDDYAFEKLFRENFASLVVYCQYKFGLNIDSAKEACHAGFVKLWESRNSVLPDLSIKGYLYTIVTNLCFDIVRHQKVTQRYEKHLRENPTADFSDSDFNRIEFNELRNNIDKAVADLPEQMRKVFKLSRYEGLKYSEIAIRLSISVKTVETQMSRALAKLRFKLSDYVTF